MVAFNYSAIANLTEDRLRREVIIPLLVAMEFCDVKDTHGNNEFGKDIVAWKSDELGKRKNLAIVAKAAKLTRSNHSEVGTQINEAFRRSYNDPVDQSLQDVQNVWVINNREMKLDLRERIMVQVDSLYKRSVRFLDMDQIWVLVEKHLPVSPRDALERLVMQLDATITDPSIDLHVGIETDADGQRRIYQHAVLKERGGQSAEGGLDETNTEHGRIVFPAGSQVWETWQASLRTGDTARFSSRDVQLSLPEDILDTLKGITGFDEQEEYTIEVGSILDRRPIPVRIVVQNDEGSEETFPYVEMRVVKAGTERIELSNEMQPIHYIERIIVDCRSRKVDMSMSLRGGQKPPAAHLDFAKMVNVFAGKCEVEVFSLDLMMTVIKSPKKKSSGDVYGPEDLLFFHDMVDIQSKFNRPLAIPDQEVSNEDAVSIGLLRSLLRNGTLESTWHKGSLTFGAEGVRNAIDRIDSLPEGIITVVEQTSVHLFGHEYAIGEKQSVLLNPRVANREEALEAADAAGSSDEPVIIDIVSAPPHKAFERYKEWLDTPSDITGMTVDDLVREAAKE